MEKNYNQDLSGMNTFRMKVSCRCFVEYSSEEELKVILSDMTLPRPLFPIGGGSNLLFTGDYPGTILHCGMAGCMPMPVSCGMNSVPDALPRVCGDLRTCP